MPDFYVTFPQKDAARKDGWVRLMNVPDRDQAHDFAMKEFDGLFAMLYDVERFKPEYFPKGEMATIDISQSTQVTDGDLTFEPERRPH